MATLRTRPEPIPYGEVLWALREDVQVTLILHDPNGVKTIYLVTKTLRPWNYASKPWNYALVLEFSDDGEVIVNGQLRIPESDQMDWATLVDAVSLSPHFPTPGDFVTTRVRG